MSQMKMFACALSVVGIQAVAGAAEPVVVAYEGGAVPGIAGAEFELVDGGPSIDDSGRVVFGGKVVGGGVTASTDTGIWRGYAGAIDLVVREGDAAPGLGAGVLIGEILAVISTADGFGFQCELTGAGVTSGNDQAVFFWQGGSAVPVVRKGDTPDTGGVLTVINMRGITDAGLVNLLASAEDGGVSRSGYWVAEMGSVTSVVALGDVLPGMPGGAPATSVVLKLHNGGGGFVEAASEGSGIPGGRVEGGWTWDGTGLTKVVATGDAMPWPAPGANFRFSVFSAVNAMGDFIISGFTNRSNPGPWALWSKDGAGLALEVIEGQPAPGTPGWSMGAPVTVSLTNSGKGLFFIDLRDPDGIAENATGVYTVEDGVIEPIAIGPAEDFDIDPAYDEFTPDTGRMTESGLVVVMAKVKLVVGGNDRRVLLGYNELGERSTLFSAAEAIDVAPAGAPSDLRTFRQLIFPAGDAQSGRNQLSETGDCVFRVEFSDRSYAIMLATVPSVCVNDIDGSGTVDLGDLSVVLANFGTSVPRGTLGDVDRNGTVDLQDLNSVLSRFGADCS